jgi:exodeoxyribonuclease-5
MGIELSDEQTAVMREIRTWYQESDEQVLRLFGPAGTGKSTMAKHIPEHLGMSGIIYGAYTGKAVNVLRTKECAPANTLHSLCQRPVGTNADRLEAIQKRLAEDDLETEERERLLKVAKALDRKVHDPVFVKSEDSDISESPLLIVDEVSMVNQSLGQDLLSYGTKVLVLGDPFQLPPVEGGGFFTHGHPFPTLHLSQIHRQALDSPVLRMATNIRMSGWGEMTVVSREHLETMPATPQLVGYDQVLVWRNATRWKIINSIRKYLRRQEGVPDVGDRVICLKNDKDYGIYNGQEFEVLEVTGTESPGFSDLKLRLIDRSDGREREFPVFWEGFTSKIDSDRSLKSQCLMSRGRRFLFTFSQALTVHKAQGSEWDRVLVMAELEPFYNMSTRKGENMSTALESCRRWLYTAVTRASQDVTLVRYA